LAGIACLAISIAVSKFVSEPVARLAEAVEKFEGKQLIQRLQASGPPEIKELAETFNTMADRLSTNIEELRLQKEEAERSELSRRQFLGEVSHNLRTPLSAILGWTDTLLDDLAKGNETSYLKRIRRETRYVSTTIERLLDLSRWERARPMLHIESFALTEALLETAENLEEAAAEKGIELNLDFPGPPCWVEADRHRVRDLFQILLENVVEHAGKDVRVEVSVRLTDDRYWVTVTDNGVGLPESLRTGWRGDPLVAATGRASLGLAIARHLAEAHKGELRLSGGPDGVGTMATFSLPVASVSENLNRSPGLLAG
jgi:two-component system sensor histidine kinase MtrB